MSYKNNFLKDVIVRLDFESPLKHFESSLPNDVNTGVLKLFPIDAERKEISHRNLEIKENDVISTSTKTIEWHFHGKNREKVLCISDKYLWIKYNTYESFENLKDELIRITDLFNTDKSLTFRSFGLRYINHISPQKWNKLTSWSSYIDNKLLSIFNVYKDPKRISRAFQVLELNIEDIKIKFQYGMHNPDHPATIKQKIFTLDLDARYNDIFQKDEIPQLLDKGHGEIKKLFESSIKDKLRVLMQ